MTGDRIAIVGMACRYPDANTPEELWQNVLGRRRAFRAIPAQRLGSRYRGGRDDPDLTYLTHAAVLRDWEFDRQRFGIPGPLFRAADLTQWLALETAADALADAGHPHGDGLDRDMVGVILGNSLTGEFTRAATLRYRWPFIAEAATAAIHDAGGPADLTGKVLRRLEQLVKGPFPAPGDESLTGALANTIAGRICNYFDFNGTGYTVDGACSSSLLAVMTGCRALAGGECDFVLTGGVDMSIDPFELVGFSRLGALAEAQMRVYDAEPTGFLPGEGCGVVALMRADDAERKGMRVYAEIIGWASSSDGSGGLSRPAAHGQTLALQRAYRRAQVSPGDIELIEGHGTGTAVGDRVELEALRTVRGSSAPAALGTVKANIGHTKAAAGVAGLIKAAMATAYRVLPPTAGCSQPHELLRGDGVPLRLLDEPEAWTSQTPRAGVSSMGFGGINAHLVLQGAGDTAASPVLSASVRRWSARIGPAEIVYIGAGDKAALAERLTALARQASHLSVAEVSDLAATAWRADGGTHRFRATLVAASPDELASAAEHAAVATAGWGGGLLFAEREGWALGTGPVPRVGLLFPGQAAPVRPQLARWAERLFLPSVPDTAATGTAIAQPTIVRQSLAALAWLRALGTEAVAACGHSLGELTALHWAGAYSAADVQALATLRGRIMAEYGVPETTMAGIAATAEDVAGLLAGTGVTIGGYNAPDQIALSGSRSAIQSVVEQARAAGWNATVLPVSHGFHSEAMRPAEQPLRQALSGIPVAALERVVVSTVTGKELTSTSDGLRELLVDQLTRPVLFSDAVAELARRCDLLVEAGPGRILTELARSNRVRIPSVTMDCGGDPSRHAFATAVLAAAGVADLDPWFAGRAFRTLALGAEPTFVANPCEDRTGWTSGGPEVSLVDIPAPVPPGRHTEVVTDDPLAVLTAHLADTLELSPSSITSASSLLADLHLNSLQVVQLVGAVAEALGRRPPDTPVSLADATVGDAADLLAGLPDATADTDPQAVPGIRPWVRPFETRWMPFPVAKATPVQWIVRAEEGHWLHRFAASGTQERTGLAVAMPAHAGTEEVAGLLREVAETAPHQLLIVHTGHPMAAGAARSVAAELQSCAVTVVELPDDRDQLDPDTVLDAKTGRYLELRRAADGSLQRSVLAARPIAGDARIPLDRGDVCLVTGGADGITAYAAAALAERTGCTLVVTGRTPGSDPRVTEAMTALRERVPAYYIPCDITEPGAVAELLASAATRGVVRGLIHGAGVNEPRLLSAITPDSLADTLRPKVSGVLNLLNQAGAQLRLVLGFGSIIGRQGLAGQAEYCLANDWLRIELERWAARNPSCRTHALEWSVWSELGMGARMNVLDTLRRLGVEPITPELGAEALFALLADPGAPVTVLLSSRFPIGAPLAFDQTDTPVPRFAERTPVRFPGVETVLEADVALGSDLYLGDHRIDGIPVLPAVIGMEAMAQAVSLTTVARLPLALSDVEFRSPVTVAEPEGRAIRLAALTGRDGTEVVLRDTVDRFTARVHGAEPSPPPAAAAQPISGDGVHPWYGSLFFHGGRFQRLAGYQELSAFRVRAWLTASAGEPWFSQFHSGQLVLGDPAAHDATLHVLLACVPHRRALPVGVRRFSVWRQPEGPTLVDARETMHTADDYEFDVDLTQPDGVLVARWQGLRLRATGPLPWPGGLPVRLAGPWLSRRLIECGFAESVELVSDSASGQLTMDCPAGAQVITAATQAAALAALDIESRPEHVTDDGLAVFRSGTRTVITASPRVLDLPEPVTVAVLMENR